MRSFLGAPIRAHGRVFGNIYLTDKQGASEFSDDDEAATLILATQAGVAIANAQLYDELRLRERWLDSVREVATTLLAGDTARAALQLVAQHARELGNADMATISVPEGEGLRIIIADGAGADGLLDVKVPLSGSLSAEVIRTERTMVVADASRSPLTQPMVSTAGVGPMILVPLALRTSTAGVPGRWSYRRASPIRGGRHPTPGKLCRAGKPGARVRTRALRVVASRHDRGQGTYSARPA